MPAPRRPFPRTCASIISIARPQTQPRGPKRRGSPADMPAPIRARRWAREPADVARCPPDAFSAPLGHAPGVDLFRGDGLEAFVGSLRVCWAVPCRPAGAAALPPVSWRRWSLFRTRFERAGRGLRYRGCGPGPERVGPPEAGQAVAAPRGRMPPVHGGACLARLALAAERKLPAVRHAPQAPGRGPEMAPGPRQARCLAGVEPIPEPVWHRLPACLPACRGAGSCGAQPRLLCHGFGTGS